MQEGGVAPGRPRGRVGYQARTLSRCWAKSAPGPLDRWADGRNQVWVLVSPGPSVAEELTTPSHTCLCTGGQLTGLGLAWG